VSAEIRMDRVWWVRDVWIRRTDWRDPAREGSRRISGGFGCTPEVSHQKRWFHIPITTDVRRAPRDAHGERLLRGA
jgi:hypothetical protein